MIGIIKQGEGRPVRWYGI